MHVSKEVSLIIKIHEIQAKRVKSVENILIYMIPGVRLTVIKQPNSINDE